MKRTCSLIAPMAVALLVNCGGTSHHDTAATLATKLSYTDPTASASEWKLVRDATATDTHLVLDLVGPTDGSKYRGIGFTLQVDPTLVKIAKFTDSKGNPVGYYQDGGVFLDKNSAGTADVAPTLQTAGVSNGKLMVGIYQKTDDEVWKVANGAMIDGASAKDCNAVILRVAIDFDSSLEATPKTVPMTILKARAIGEHVGTLLNRRTLDVPLKIGALALQ
jgi:hypothetical protein